MVLLFEVVGAVSLRRNGAAHETWERARVSLTWVPEPAQARDRDDQRL